MISEKDIGKLHRTLAVALQTQQNAPMHPPTSLQSPDTINSTKPAKTNPAQP